MFILFSLFFMLSLGFGLSSMEAPTSSQPRITSLPLPGHVERTPFQSLRTGEQREIARKLAEAQGVKRNIGRVSYNYDYGFYKDNIEYTNALNEVVQQARASGNPKLIRMAKQSKRIVAPTRQRACKKLFFEPEDQQPTAIERLQAAVSTIAIKDETTELASNQ